MGANFSFLKALIAANAVLGIALLEYAWFKTRRYRNPIKELNAQFPELCRNDAPNWQKWKLYPGAMTLLIPRFLLGISIIVLKMILLYAFLIGHDRKKPMRGLRKFLVQWTVTLGVHGLSTFSFFTILTYKRLRAQDVNYYKNYLGSLGEQQRYQKPEVKAHPDVPKRGPGPSSTLVCNHIGLLEIFNQIASPMHPSFTPKKAVSKVPVIRKLAEAIQSLYMERGGS